MEQRNFISGIYNHCDRWCERCQFTNRCRVYFEEKKHFNESDGNPDFVKIISQNFSKALELLHKIADERGIDLDNIEIEEEDSIESFEEKMNHPLPKAAKDYGLKVMEWMKSTNELESEQQLLLENINLGVKLDQSDKDLRLIDEALNIINWYELQISVKLTSAISYYPHNPDFEDDIQNMYHSSAKIAMIGIENSMKAWQSLLDVIPDKTDDILGFLIQLKKLRSKIEQKFPKLNKFKRPGFDD